MTRKDCDLDTLVQMALVMLKIDCDCRCRWSLET
jgi:hypothetical protein